jgi:hypothetical protein
MGYPDPEGLRAQLVVLEARIVEQRDQLKHLDGREREAAYWNIRAAERKLLLVQAMLEEIEKREFYYSVFEDIGSL